eukprot:5143375-Amphidinium_carterae.1
MSYPAARKALNQHRLARGWVDKGKKGGKGYEKGKYGAKDFKGYGKGKGSWPKGKSSSGGDRLAALIARTKCAQCGKVGHWKRECPEKRQGSAYFIADGAMD